MKDRISALAKGKFEYEPIKLQLEPTQLRHVVVSGDTLTGTITLENAHHTRLKGFVVGTTVVQIANPTFAGQYNEISYEVVTAGMEPGDTILGELLVVTDCGEQAIPYEIRVVAPVLQDDKGIVPDFETFVQRAKQDSDEGAALFSKKEFREVFLHRDVKGEILYHHIRKHDSANAALEEFLVATGAKEQIHFQLEKDEYQYEMESGEQQENLNISVNTWGSIGIRVTSDSDFVHVEERLYSTDEFVAGVGKIPFVVCAEGLVPGMHKARLIVQSPFERQVVTIVVHNPAGEDKRKETRQKKEKMEQMLRAVLYYFMGKLPRSGLATLMRNLGETSEAVTAYGHILDGQREEAAEYVLKVECTEQPKFGTPWEEVREYLWGRFVCCEYAGAKEHREELVTELRRYYDNGYHNWQLFLMLLHWDSKYIQLPDQMIMEEMQEYIEAQVCSPFFYLEVVKRIAKDPSLLHRLDDSIIPILYWGMKHGLFQKEFALCLSMLAERVTEYSEMLLCCLTLQYKQYQLEDTLQCICSMLIRQEKMERRFFPWFALGVEKQLRITELYEYYMCTRDPEKNIEIPHSVITYFQYENHLNRKVKAQLFSYLVCNKKTHPEAYIAYQKNIHKFAKKQLEQGMVSPELGVLYEDLILECGVQEQLPAVMFKCQLSCENQRMDNVCVVHAETRQEQIVPLVNGKALIDIYTPNYQIYFVDKDGSYYLSTVPCEVVKLTNLEQYAEICFENGSNHPYILFHLLDKIMSGYAISGRQAVICHVILKAKVLHPYYQARVVSMLYDYYVSKGEKDMIPKIMGYFDPEYFYGTKRKEMMDCLIQNGMMEEAYEAIGKFGWDGCQTANLVYLISDRLEKKAQDYDPLLLALIRKLCCEGYHTKEMMRYLLAFDMGSIEEIGCVFTKAEAAGVNFKDEDYEKVLAQVLFVQANPLPFIKLFMKYYASGNNRILVKAFLSYTAYGYVVDKYHLDSSILEVIRKEAMGIRNDVLVLALLKAYSEQKELDQRQLEYADYEISAFAKDGVILPFMQEFRGKIPLPYSVENSVIAMHYANTNLPVNVIVVTEDGQEEMPMHQVFPGVYVRTFLMFYGEKLRYYIREDESGKTTEVCEVACPAQSRQDASFYRMVNQMQEARENGYEEKFEQIRAGYEKYQQLGEQLFQLL